MSPVRLPDPERILRQVCNFKHSEVLLASLTNESAVRHGGVRIKQVVDAYSRFLLLQAQRSRSNVSKSSLQIGLSIVCQFLPNSRPRFSNGLQAKRWCVSH